LPCPGARKLDRGFPALGAARCFGLLIALGASRLPDYLGTPYPPLCGSGSRVRVSLHRVFGPQSEGGFRHQRRPRRGYRR
jgi:hypothetical protein